MPPKRTFSVSSPPGDAENGDLTLHRRQRTSSTTFVRSPIPLTKPKPSSPRVLKTTASPTPNLITATSKESNAKGLTDIISVKARPPHPSGIPRPVASKVKCITNTTGVTKASVPASTKPSTATKPSPAASLVGKALKLKENQVQVAKEMPASFVDRLPSIPSPPPDPPRLVTSKGHPRTRSQLPRSESKTAAIEFPSSEPTKHQEAPERPLPDRPQHNRVFSAEVKTVKQQMGACAHLAASDCEASVSFLQGPHIEVWDIPDDGNIPCPAYLYLTAKDLSAWEGIPLALPEVTLIDIQCRTKAGSSRFSNRQLSVDRWGCKFEGHEVPFSSESRAPLAHLSPGTISVEMKWERVYSVPAKVAPKGTLGPLQPSNSHNRPSLSSILFSDSDPKPGFNKVPGRGWCMKFWIPIPAHLFLRKETRTFEIDVQVFIAPGGTNSSIIDMARMAESISTRAEMTVSHLRTARELDNMDFFYGY